MHRMIGNYRYFYHRYDKTKYYAIHPAFGPQFYYTALGPQVLIVFMKFLLQSMLPDLLFHCYCEDSCFEISLMVEVFHSISLTLSHFSYKKEPLMSKTELRARETFVNKIICSVDPYENHDP